jgi:cyclopropane-fatty-acyl-phospholipid synthase
MGLLTAVALALADAAARRLLLGAISRIKVGSLNVEEASGRLHQFDSGTPGPTATLQVFENSFYRQVLLGGEIGFGEAYQAGVCNSPDLVALIQLAILNRREVKLNSGPMRLISRAKDIRLHRGRANTVEQSKHNIHAHYDLGNDFFSLFLDETMTYSCAVFETDTQDLVDAQKTKYRHISEKAQLSADDSVLEIGTGWGGFAIFAAQTYGCRVTTVTISKEQFELATQRVREAGLAELIEIKLLDYRDVSGTYDKIVSIEMFEAVGAEYFEVFFSKCGELLRSGGRLAMQVITVPDSAFKAQKTGVNWIQKYIFPGGVLPSLEEMVRCNAHTGLMLDSSEDIGLDYATTLHQWRERFSARETDARSMGYDQHFIKTWDYYLASCEASFLSRNTANLQVAFVKTP